MRGLLVIAALLLAGCGKVEVITAEEANARALSDKLREQRQAQLDNPTPVGVYPHAERFSLQRAVVVQDSVAYQDRRAVYVLVDSVTGKEYIGVSGIGITELVSTGSKNPREAEQ